MLCFDYEIINFYTKTFLGKKLSVTFSEDHSQGRVKNRGKVVQSNVSRAEQPLTSWNLHEDVRLLTICHGRLAVAPA